MADRRIEEKIERLGRLRDAGPGEAAAALRTALSDRVNLVVAKAAKVAREIEARELIPELKVAFARLFEDAAARDPQCWGKNALAIALRDLGLDESDLFVRGLRHIQMEPVWGGQQDTAPTLRAACAAALPQCPDLTRDRILRLLVDALTDSAEGVRLDAARTIEHMGGGEACLLLRLKARLGDSDASVMGQVFESLLRLEPGGSLEFVAKFLDSPEESVCSEAALALGSSRLEAVVKILTDAWTRQRNEVFLQGLSITRLPAAREFLMELAKNGREREAAQAREALALHGDSGDTSCG